MARPEHNGLGGSTITVATDAPADALRALGTHVGSIDARNVWARDLDPLGAALRRLLEDL